MMQYKKGDRSMKKIFIMMLMICVIMPAAFGAQEINMVGSTTVLPIAQATAEAFMEENKNIEISVGGGGSSIGAKALMSGTCDIANSSRPLKDSEIDQAISKGIKPQPHIVAMDGIVVIVNRSNNLKNIPLADLKAIYTGDIKNWTEVGDSNQDIVVVSRDTASGTFEAFSVLALGGAKVRADSLMQASNQAVLTTVAQTPNAIGYIGLGYVSDAVNVVTVDGITASKDTVLTMKYPISRPLYMYTGGQASGAIKKYLDFVKSAEGQKIVEAQGFVAIA
jgi:phosphate transport system substrate-binding protein